MNKDLIESSFNVIWLIMTANSEEYRGETSEKKWNKAISLIETQLRHDTCEAYYNFVCDIQKTFAETVKYTVDSGLLK